MSVLEVPKWPRTFLLRHLDPPAGWTPEGWDSYINLVLRGEDPLTTFESPGGVPRGEKASMVFTRTGDDVATIGMHFLHRDGDAGVADFVPADRATIQARIATLWNALKANHTTDLAYDRLVWHRFAVGLRKPNPAAAEHVNSPAVAGTQDPADQLAPQTATSVTFKTSSRKGWGRVYLPATVAGNVIAGRFAAGYIEAVRNAFGAFIDGCADDGLPLVIWSPRQDGKALQFFKRDADHPESAFELGLDLPDSSSFARTVDSVQVDDVVDTIRSRRWKHTLLRETHTLGA